ncbi:MAG: ADP-dependent NAD(P)H-hydrate dehydratase / NAD(P)H-hydrate epimerase [Actinomycetota bacterium]|jgi:NAD(P)H-hydrate epimerase
MIPVLTVEEMAAVDADAPESVEVLIGRAGSAVARSALRVLGGAYGRRAVVVAGKGNNGADGRVAAESLVRRGVRARVIDAASVPATLPEADLVVDAAYGTGFHGAYAAPEPGGADVLAVDIPSGVNGDTGEAADGAVFATVTVTFAALKPGLLLGDGPQHAGRVEVVDIGLDTSSARAWLLEDRDARSAFPPRRRVDHKWKSGVLVLGGSPGLVGAPWLAATSALHVGAGNVRLAIPGATGWEIPPSEIYSRLLPAEGWAAQAAADAQKCQAVVVGPGLGTDEATGRDLRTFLAASQQAVVADADALTLLGRDAAVVLAERPGPTVLTPHDAEFERLTGAKPGPHRIDDVRALARATGAVVLLKGPTTIVADPDGRAMLTTAGGPALATAGTGDVLAGTIAAFLARGAEPVLAAAAAAHAHGAAASAAPAGLVAGDLATLIPRWLSDD